MCGHNHETKENHIKEEMVDFSVTKEGGSRNSKIIAFHFEFPAVEDVLDDWSCDLHRKGHQRFGAMLLELKLAKTQKWKISLFLQG